MAYRHSPRSTLLVSFVANLSNQWNRTRLCGARHGELQRLGECEGKSSRSQLSIAHEIEIKRSLCAPCACGVPQAYNEAYITSNTHCYDMGAAGLGPRHVLRSMVSSFVDSHGLIKPYWGSKRIRHAAMASGPPACGTPGLLRQATMLDLLHQIVGVVILREVRME